VAGGSGVIIASGFQGTVDIGCGPMMSTPTGSSYLARLDGSGACLWSKRLSAPAFSLRSSLGPAGVDGG
jgi:hypothetical protein